MLHNKIVPVARSGVSETIRKLAAIREELRAAFAAAGANPIPALDRKIRKLSKNSKAGAKELRSLGLLRNALAQGIEDH